MIQYKKRGHSVKALYGRKMRQNGDNMNHKKLFAITGISFVFVNLLTFCLFYIPNYVLMLNVAWLEYLRIFLEKLCEFLLPAVAATLLFISFSTDGLKKTIRRAICLSLPRIIYLLPYYYLYYIFNFYDSVEAITLSALVTLFGVALLFGQILLLFVIIRSFARMPLLRKAKEALPINERKSTPKDVLRTLKKNADEEVSSSLSDKEFFNFSRPTSLGIFAAVFASFIINFVIEIYDTILFVIDIETSYGGNYYAEEIIYIIACYLFLVVELMASHAICCLIRNALNKNEKENEETK